MADTRIDYLLIGGGRTSANAAQAIREGDPEGSITIVAGEDRKPYDRPPLSKNFLEGRPPHPDDVESKPDDFFDKHNVALIRGVSAQRVDRELKLVALENGKSFEYGKLLLATGASPVRLKLPGSDGDDVFYLRTVDDAMRIRDRAKTAKSAVMVGAGYIGTEVGATLSGLGLKCTMIGRETSLWDKFASKDTGNWLQNYFKSKGVEVKMGAQVTEFVQGGVKLDSGEVIQGEMVVVGIGARPNIGLARDAGLEVDATGGVVTDSTLRTSDPSIWAAGDIASYDDVNAGRRVRHEHYMNADWQGTQAGRNMAGAKETFDKVPYFYSDMFDIHFLLRGDPDGGQRAKLIGDMDSAEFIELYAYLDGRLAMGIVFTKDYTKQDVIGDKIADFILARKRVSDLEESSFS